MNSKIILLAKESGKKLRSTNFNFIGITEGEKARFSDHRYYNFVVPFEVECIEPKKANEPMFVTALTVIGYNIHRANDYDLCNKKKPVGFDESAASVIDTTERDAHTVALYPDALDNLAKTGFDITYTVPPHLDAYNTENRKFHFKLDNRFKDSISLYIDVAPGYWINGVSVEDLPKPVTADSPDVADRITNDKKYENMTISEARKKARDEINAENKKRFQTQYFFIRKISLVVSTDPAYAHKVLLGNENCLFLDTETAYCCYPPITRRMKFLVPIVTNIHNIIDTMLFYKYNGKKNNYAHNKDNKDTNLRLNAKIDDLANYVVDCFTELKLMPLLNSIGIDKDVIIEAVHESAKANSL